MGDPTHMDTRGKARMVNIGDKDIQHRIAIAAGRITMDRDTVKLIRENEIKKGDVLTVAEIAGIQSAKRTDELIPLCHPLNITRVSVDTEIQDEQIIVTSEVECVGRTGVEMEALTAVTVALLTIYDMCKSVDKNMNIRDIHLIKKIKRDI
ncbi:cyclic pyranopterin monophosphate synthase MoaC [bacterium]|nr:MAG: cyclic pyranopterin monophosphate synthase MoaC [bacterium]